MERENKRLRVLIDEVEEALRESETKFRLVFEKSVDPILLMDGLRFIAANQAALTMLRCTDREDLLGLSPSEISPEEQADGQRSDMKERAFMALIG